MGIHRWKKYKIEVLPNKMPSESREQEIKAVVDKIISFRIDEQAEDAVDLEGWIDQMDWELYELTGGDRGR